MLLIQNKKGDIESIIYIVIFLAIVAIVLLLITNVNTDLFTQLEQNLNDSGYSGTEAMTRTTEFKEVTQSRVWDYAFLGIFFGCLIAIGLSAYAVRISPVFYWIYGLLSLFVLGVGVILSNFWQELAGDPEFATTITQFPIMNSLLGTYYPVVVTAIIVIAMIILFGKPPEAGGQP